MDASTARQERRGKEVTTAPISIPRSVPPPKPDAELVLGIAGLSYADLYDPAKLAELCRVFDAYLQKESPEDFVRFDAYRACRGEGMTPQAVSAALLAAAPWVSRFVAKLFGIEGARESLQREVRARDPLWKFKHEFAKKRILVKDAGKAWTHGPDLAQRVAEVALGVVGGAKDDEELWVARGTLSLLEVDEIARKVKKAGGAQWTDELRLRAQAVLHALETNPSTHAVVSSLSGEGAAETAVALALDAIEAHVAARARDRSDPASRWPSLHHPHALDFQNLVQLRRPDPKVPELFVGPEETRRQRGNFKLTDKRGSVREAEEQVDYCVLCHNRDKDACSKGAREKGGGFKKNPLGVELRGCPLEERISEFHTMRRDGDPLAALALVTIDNPMLAGTGHRICNDCMKACIFQKQEPVNIPQIETRVLTEVLSMPWGLEIYGLLLRWNPLNVTRPHARPYNGKNVLVVGLGPAGYTLAHHLASEGFGVVAIDGLKLEPLPALWTGKWEGSQWIPPVPVKDAMTLYGKLDERILLGFGGVSEYGITVRWDKNFLTLLYVTLRRNKNIRMYGGVRFGGTLTLEDAWALGIDHVAIAAGAGRPTLINVKNDLARGMRQASDFLMALQLTGAYKKSSIANLQVHLPAVVIGGGLTAIDTATELLAYYVVQVEKTVERFEALRKAMSEDEVRKLFDEEEWNQLQVHLDHGRQILAEKEAARREGREPRLQQLLDAWGGVTLAYRKTLQESPAYRLNHEEVIKSLEEGVRYAENLSPTEAVVDARGHVVAMKFKRKDGSEIELPARTVCVAAGTSPNVTYEREHPGTFVLDAKGQYFQTHKIEGGKPVPCAPNEGFFTSYAKDGRMVSFYGDNHPFYAGSVVKAMASAKDGYPHVVALFPEISKLDPKDQPARDRKLASMWKKLDEELLATVVAVNRLTRTIVEVVVHAPLAARKFQPGQFYRLQNYETHAPILGSTRLAMEGLALTGAWTDPEKGLLGTIVLEMGGSSRLCAALDPGQPIVLMGPTGAPTEIEDHETVMLCGGGLGNAVLFSIARAFKAMGSRVLYFAGYKDGADLFKQDEIERFTDQVIWATDSGKPIEPRRPQDAHFRGNIVQAMVAYAKGEIGRREFLLQDVDRIIAIGSDRMMAAVGRARHEVLAPYLKPKHRAIGSINSPMQCMMKEVCAQCLQRHVDPETGKHSVVFSCFNQDQDLDKVDFGHLAQRLRANSMQEKLANAWLDLLLAQHPGVLRV
jgi:NADPH-dependent glutamate synthase beta subunit-like oxidoreductase/NAD(P)H-flavin reductase